MALLHKSIFINAPVEKVFNYMDDPHNLAVVWPGLVEVSNVERLPNGGVSYDFIYKAAGLRLKGHSEDTEHVQNKRTVSLANGGVDYLATVDFEPLDSGTKVTMTNDYTVPVPLVGKLAEAVIVKMNEQEIGTFLENLKAVLEA